MPDGPYRTSTYRWRGAGDGFGDWQCDGTARSAEGDLRLDPRSACPDVDMLPGEYEGRNFYNGGSFYVGEAVSPATPVEFTEAIASWNADTADGTWIETHLRARVDRRWTKWYNMGVWGAGCSTIWRHSVGGQGDDDAAVYTDILVMREGLAADALQVKLRLFSESLEFSPSVRNVAVAVSTAPRVPERFLPGDPALWGKQLPVPLCSQMVYPDGGNVWCSPVSVAMVLGYWQADLESPCEGRVREAVSGVYDWLYDGHGNWPFNAVYAATHNLDAYVSRFVSLRDAEGWIAAGVPVVLSYAWGEGELGGAPIPSCEGHLAVLVGFDGEGNPIVNDPAAQDDRSVRRTYSRQELERLWLQHSGGMVYLIHPRGQ